MNKHIQSHKSAFNNLCSVFGSQAIIQRRERRRGDTVVEPWLIECNYCNLQSAAQTHSAAPMLCLPPYTDVYEQNCHTVNKDKSVWPLCGNEADHQRSDKIYLCDLAHADKSYRDLCRQFPVWCKRVRGACGDFLATTQRTLASAKTVSEDAARCSFSSSMQQTQRNTLTRLNWANYEADTPCSA